MTQYKHMLFNMLYTYVTTMNPPLGPKSRSASLQVTFLGKSALRCTLINESSSERAMPHFGRLVALAMDSYGLKSLGGGSLASTALAATLFLVGNLGDLDSSRRVTVSDTLTKASR
jgi:hypothetical protein